jgi:hypothetical protein
LQARKSSDHVLSQVDGRVDQRDTLLTDRERAEGMMLVCISRAAKGQQLTLDL